ncbi:ribonuclease P protein component [Bordetella sp. FB-8]|uniref:ribonuclease P protein component n=1 Tax=Bordetella sp. FB-8 TaxID=1159870 RepID=UPI000360FF1B|nr:ribonuclease P protein component [Bordetella sp. FB-8]
MSRATLPAQARLHRPSEFAAALKGRRLARGAFFVVSAASAAAPDAKPAGSADSAAETSRFGEQPACARLGLVIAKRYAPHAVTRNALKRVIREAFRTQRLALPARDYVVRLQSRIAPISLTELKRAARAEVDAHFERIAR